MSSLSPSEENLFQATQVDDQQKYGLITAAKHL